MVKRLAALTFIFLCTTLAWAILGGTVFSRTYSLNGALKGQVASSWGTAQTQDAPRAGYNLFDTKTVVATDAAGGVITKTEATSRWVAIPLEKSRVNVNLALDYRKKGLLWYSTYGVQFAGEYEFTNTSDKEQDVNFILDLPARQAMYDGLALAVNGVNLPVKSGENQFYAEAAIPAHAKATFSASYRSQGLDTWSYDFGDATAQVKDFQLHVNSNLPTYNLPENSLSPTSETKTADGWQLDWNYKTLISGFHVGVAMPEKLQPRPDYRADHFFCARVIALLFLRHVLSHHAAPD